MILSWIFVHSRTFHDPVQRQKQFRRSKDLYRPQKYQVMQCVFRHICCTLRRSAQSLYWLTAVFIQYRYADLKYLTLRTLELFTDPGIKEMIIISTQGCANLILAFLVVSGLQHLATQMVSCGCVSILVVPIYSLNTHLASKW